MYSSSMSLYFSFKQKHLRGDLLFQEQISKEQKLKEQISRDFCIFRNKLFRFARVLYCWWNKPYSGFLAFN